MLHACMGGRGIWSRLEGWIVGGVGSGKILYWKHKKNADKAALVASSNNLAKVWS